MSAAGNDQRQPVVGTGVEEVIAATICYPKGSEVMPASFASISETAQRYSVSERIRRWIAQGLIRGYRVGRRLLPVDPAEVDTILRRIPSVDGAA